MIGKAEWFKRRKYGGWGLTPKTWQGWVYVAVSMIPLISFHIFQLWDTKTRAIVTIVWIAIIVVDSIEMMIKLKKDEREIIHEALAERNALWGMMAVLIIGLLYQVIISAIRGIIQIDWWILGALFVGIIIKSISNLYLDRKN